MPEIGQSGSEGGGAQANARPLPLSAAASEKKPTQEDSKASRVAEASSFGLPEQDAPASAPGSAHSQKGASPFQGNAHALSTERNCVAARRGGEQQEVKDQSVG